MGGDGRNRLGNQAMSQQLLTRARLKRLVQILFLTLIGAFVFVLLSGIFGRSINQQSDAQINLSPGETSVVRIQGQRAWATRLSPLLVQQCAENSAFLVDSFSGCSSDLEYCFIAMQTQRAGVDIRFVEAKPFTLGEEVPWCGGFVDPGTEVVFDLLGRAYANAHRVEALPILDNR